ncbi:TetR/AcrR family transcriptional regulator [Oricola sp.]|uniref:TetR/AcrR family transcriptional regulator n=1 Tax=Oricola sp. TaxID=1979950 RepID=UPI003BAC4ECE
MFDPDDVLDKVIDVFWELGYDAADTETLSRRAGLTKPSLYNAFGSKEDLFVTAINRYSTTRSRASLEALARPDKPADGIRDYFLNLAQNVAAPGRPKGCLMLSIALPLKDRLPKVAAELEAAPKESAAGMIEYFARQTEMGNLPRSFDSMAAISLLRDLSAALIVQARGGAPLNVLKTKATRNAKLVLYAGEAEFAE